MPMLHHLDVEHEGRHHSGIGKLHSSFQSHQIFPLPVTGHLPQGMMPMLHHLDVEHEGRHHSNIGKSHNLWDQGPISQIVLSLNCEINLIFYFIRWPIRLKSWFQDDLSFYWIGPWLYFVDKILCSRQKTNLNLPTSSLHLCSHLLEKIVGSRFTISSPRFQKNGVKIHRCGKRVRSRFTKLKYLLRQDSPHFRKEKKKKKIKPQ